MEKNDFGKGSIELGLFNYIVDSFKDKETILELGSGWATGQLAKHFNMISIENDKNWLDKYRSRYIYAPLKYDGIDYWYNVDAVKEELKDKNYDLILIDGPPAYKKGTRKRRRGFFRHIGLFNTDATIIFDDVDRKEDRNHFMMVSDYLQRKGKIFTGSKKMFGVL